MLLAQLDQAVEDRLPVLVAREIVVGDEEAGDALRGIGAHDGLDVVGRAVARLAPLHVDDGAEAALERTAAAGIEAGIVPGDAGHRPARQDRQRRRRHLRHVAQIVVDWLGLAAVDLAQQRGDAAFAFAGEQDDPEIERRFEIVRHFRQHREAAAHVKAADHHGNPGGAEFTGDIERAGKLIGLHADETDEAGFGIADLANGALDVDDGVALVIGLDVDIDVVTERLRSRTFGHQPIHAGEAVRGNERPPPLDHVAVGVVMRRLDQDYLEGPPRHEPASPPPNRADDTMFSCARKCAIHGTSAISDRKAPPGSRA